MQPSLPRSCNAGRCGTCSGGGNDTDCRSGKFQLRASDPEKFCDGKKKRLRKFFSFE